MRISDWSSDVCSSDLQVLMLNAVQRDLVGADRLLERPDRGTRRPPGVPRAGRLLLRGAARIALFLEPLAQRPLGGAHARIRSEERRVGKACLRLCRSRLAPYH